MNGMYTTTYKVLEVTRRGRSKRIVALSRLVMLLCALMRNNDHFIIIIIMPFSQASQRNFSFMSPPASYMYMPRKFYNEDQTQGPDTHSV